MGPKSELKIKRVMAEVLGTTPGAIGESTSPANTETWDSLRHMNLIVALECAFGVTFDDDVLGELTSFRAIVDELERLEAVLAA